MNKSKLLFISAIALVATACSGEKTGADTSATNVSTTLVENEPFESNINIRFVTMDSISLNYVLAQNIAAQAQSLATELQTYQAQLQNQLQNQYNQIQQKAQNNGYLSQASYEADLKDLEQKNATYQNLYAKKEQAAALQIEQLQKELRDSIDNFINTYNKSKHYDAILYRDASIYFNPALDITDEIVAGLNERYTGKATADGAAAAATGTPTLSNTGNEITNPATTLPSIGK